MRHEAILDAYHALAAAYPQMNAAQGTARLRALARSLHTQAELDAAVAVIADEDTRERFRERLMAMVKF